METKEFNEGYAKLNPAQKKAVDTIEGPVAVLAGPGTGKTSVLTLRIANILKKTDAKPEQILALTFTNAGVFAMRKKLLNIIGDGSYRVNIFTFHSFCEHVIKNFPFYFSDFENKRPVDDVEKVKILEEIIPAGEYKKIVSINDELDSIGRIQNAINNIKKEGLTPDELEKKIPEWRNALLSDDDIYYKKKYKTFNVGDIKPAEEKKIEDKIEKVKEIVKVFSKYQESLDKKKLYDFYDMILVVIRELEKNEDLRFDLQEQFQYIHVDEHQDTNEGQNKLIELLTNAEHLEGRANIFTVGDEKQSIYRFQGASEKTFAHLLSLFKDVLVIPLEKNYRSTKDILDASHSLISFNGKSHEDQKLSPFKTDRKPIDVIEFSNYKFELLYVAEQIKKQIKEGIDPNEIAIIYRKNKHIDDIKHVLLMNDIPFTVSSKDNIFNDGHIQSVITLLKVIYDFSDDLSLSELLFSDFLKFEPNEVTQILNAYAFTKRKTKSNLLSFISNEDTLQRLGVLDSAKLINFANTLKAQRTVSESKDFLNFLKICLNEFGYIEHIVSSNTGIIEILKLDKIFEEVKRQQLKKKNYSLKNFIEYVDACIKYGIELKSEDLDIVDGVKLMTAHGSKGLEFKYVYIVNATRKNWEKQRQPQQFSLPLDTYTGSLEDERRLFYVAMTRAKDGLTITSSTSDFEGSEQEISQFVTEISEENIIRPKIDKFERDNLSNIALFLNYKEKDESVFNLDYLRALFLNGGMNVTALNNYLKCPIKYLYRNLVRLPSEYSPQLIYGDIMHKSLENFFNECKEKNEIVSLDFLLNQFKKLILDSNLNESDFKKYDKRGIESLSGYYENYHSLWTPNIVTEQSIKKSIELQDGSLLKISGKLDKIEYLDGGIDGRINLVDYKTGRTYSEKSKEDKESLERQIIFYHILLDGYREGDVIIENATLDFIEKNKKTGKFEQKSKGVSSKDKEELLLKISEVAGDILSGEFLKKGCNKKDCEFCRLYNSTVK